MKIWKLVAATVQLSACLALAADKKEEPKKAGIKARDAGAVRYKVWAVLEKGDEVSKKERAELEKILSDRIAGHKVTVASEGKDRLSVTVHGKPGEFTKETLEKLEGAIKRQGNVSFHMAHEDYEDFDPKKLPKDAKLLSVRPAEAESDEKPRTMLVQKKAEFDGDQVHRLLVSNELGRWQLNLSLSDEGADRFYDLSVEHNKRDNFDGRPFAIVIDGVVISAPVFNEPIAGGKAQITGDFSEAEVRAIAASVSRPLPVPLNVLSKKFLPPAEDR